MTKADGNCNRCKGKGMVVSPVVHFGVPGLCFACDGIGTYEAEAAKKEAVRKAKVAQAAFFRIDSMVREVGEKNGGCHQHLSYEKRQIIRKLPHVFSTEDYAEATGQSKKDAWIELCRTNRGTVSPAMCPETLKPIGWMHGTQA